MEIKTFEAEWEGFLKGPIQEELKVLPPEAHALYIKICKRCFYGGGVSMFDLTLSELIGRGREDQKSFLISTKREIEVFQFLVESGEA